MRPATPELGKAVRLEHQCPELGRKDFYVQGYTEDGAGVLVSHVTHGIRRLELLSFYVHDAEGREVAPRWDVVEGCWIPARPAEPERRADDL